MATHDDGNDDTESPEAQTKNRPRMVGMEEKDTLGMDEEEERGTYVRCT